MHWICVIHSLLFYHWFLFKSYAIVEPLKLNTSHNFITYTFLFLVPLREFFLTRHKDSNLHLNFCQAALWQCVLWKESWHKCNWNWLELKICTFVLSIHVGILRLCFTVVKYNSVCALVAFHHLLDALPSLLRVVDIFRNSLRHLWSIKDSCSKTLTHSVIGLLCVRRYLFNVVKWRSRLCVKCLTGK